MKYILSVIVLLSSTYALPLFRCVCDAQKKHHKIKESDETFLSEGMNMPQPVTLHLRNPDDHAERIIARSIPHIFFKKTAEWHIEIVNDQNGCLGINDVFIASPQETNKTNLHMYTWELHPKKCGIALVRATYTAPYRKDNPYVQEFLVTVE